MRQRVGRFSEVADLAGFFLQGELAVKAEDFAHRQLDPEACRRILLYSLWSLETLPDWNRDAIETCLQELAARTGHRIRDFLFPLFVAVTGKAASLSVMESMAALGPDLSKARLRGAVEALGGVSGKQRKKLEKDWRQLAEP